MEIHISDWTHKFQNKTGLDAKDNSELYKSNQVISAHLIQLLVPAFLCPLSSAAASMVVLAVHRRFGWEHLLPSKAPPKLLFRFTKQLKLCNMFFTNKPSKMQE